MSVLGAMLGVVGGLIVCWCLKVTRWIGLPSEIYHLSFLPVTVRWGEVFLICLITLGVAILASIFPALGAARRSPVEGLRYES